MGTGSPNLHLRGRVGQRSPPTSWNEASAACKCARGMDKQLSPLTPPVVTYPGIAGIMSLKSRRSIWSGSNQDQAPLSGGGLAVCYMQGFSCDEAISRKHRPVNTWLHWCDWIIVNVTEGPINQLPNMWNTCLEYLKYTKKNRQDLSLQQTKYCLFKFYPPTFFTSPMSEQAREEIH